MTDYEKGKLDGRAEVEPHLRWALEQLVLWGEPGRMVGRAPYAAAIRALEPLGACPDCNQPWSNHTRCPARSPIKPIPICAHGKHQAEECVPCGRPPQDLLQPPQAICGISYCRKPAGHRGTCDSRHGEPPQEPQELQT